MRRLATAIAVVLASLVITSVAVAGIYAGPKQWYSGQSASSGFSQSWLRNYFSTWGSGYDKTVTFIDNQQYGWHNTVRNTSQTTQTYAPYPLTTKGYCKAHSSYFHGSCTIY